MLLLGWMALCLMSGVGFCGFCEFLWGGTVGYCTTDINILNVKGLSSNFFFYLCKLDYYY